MKASGHTSMHASTQRAGVRVQPVRVAVLCGAFEGEAASGLEECFGAWGGENAVELWTVSWNSTVEVGCRGHTGHEKLSTRNTQDSRLAARGARHARWKVAILPYTIRKTIRSC